jgi:hypothetical protein
MWLSFLTYMVDQKSNGVEGPTTGAGMSYYLESIQRNISSEFKPKVLDMAETVDGGIAPALTSAGFTNESNSFEGMNTCTSGIASLAVSNMDIKYYIF